MAFYVKYRFFPWPDEPLPNFKGNLNLWEASIYAGIERVRVNSQRTADRDTDKTYILQSVPSFSWVDTITDQVVASRFPGIGNSNRNYTYESRGFDSRLFERPQPAWIFTSLSAVTPPTTAQTLPALYNDVKNYTYTSRTFDLRLLEHPADAWIFRNLPAAGGPTTAQIFPALLRNLTLPPQFVGIDVSSIRQPTNHWTTVVTGDIWVVGTGGFRVDSRFIARDSRYLSIPQRVFTTGTPAGTFQPAWAYRCNSLIFPGAAR